MPTTKKSSSVQKRLAKKRASLRGKNSLNRSKEFERQVARDVVGGVRVGGRGDNEVRKSCDVYNDTTIFECKKYKSIPSPNQLKKWLKLVITRARQDSKKGVLCFQLFGKKDYWFIVRMKNESAQWEYRWYYSKMENPFMWGN